MENITSWLEGKKTYIVALVLAVLGAYTAMGHIVPDEVYVILSALGLGTLRAGVDKVSAVATAVKKPRKPRAKKVAPVA